MTQPTSASTSDVTLDLSALSSLVKVTDERQALPVPTPPPATALDQGLLAMGKAVAAAPEQRKVLVCKDLLGGATLQKAQQEASQVFPKIFKNRQEMFAYGTPAVEAVNGLIDRLLKEVEPIKIPEITAVTRKLNADMRNVRSKYDVSDPKIRQDYEKYANKARGFFFKGKTMFEMLIEDITSTESQLDKVRDQLRDYQAGMIRNIGFYDEYYELNQAEVQNLIYVIGVMEIIRDNAAINAKAIEEGDASLGDQGGEMKAELVDFASNMDIKIGEYKSRLFVAWATSPQIRMMRTLDIGMAEKLNEMCNLVIPTMKATLVQWRMLMQTYQASQLGDAVSDAYNETLTSYAAAGAEMVPLIALMIQQPTMQAATFKAFSDSFAVQSEGILAAMDAGDARRAENEAAMIEAKDAMQDSGKKVADGKLQRILGAATKDLPLEIIKSVPASQQTVIGSVVQDTPAQPAAAPVAATKPAAKQFNPNAF